jgi:hypothetical protein
MFAKPTVFIIGAGASSELKLPLGSTLRDNIALTIGYRFKGSELQDGDETLLDAIRRHFNDETITNTYVSAGRDLAATMPVHASIDEALHYWSAKPEAVQFGKIAIVNEILRAERNSSLFEDRKTGRVETDKAMDAWLWPFLSMAVGSQTREEIEGVFDNITVINFNYDRTVEHYLLGSSGTCSRLWRSSRQRCRSAQANPTLWFYRQAALAGEFGYAVRRTRERR